MRAVPPALLLAGLLAACTSAGPGAERAQPPPEAPAEGAPRSAEDGDLLVVLRPMARDPSEVVQRLALRYRLVARAAWPMESLGRDCVVFDAIGGRVDPALLARLQADPLVELAQVNLEHRALAAGQPGNTDPHADLQYARAQLGLDRAHLRVTGRGVRIAVIDTGADVDHPDLRGQVDEARNFVAERSGFTTDRHGTAIAGVIGARTDNGVGIGGVAPGARLHLLKACWYPEAPARDAAVCSSYTLALALDHAVGKGYDLVNLSLGGPEDPLLARLAVAGAERGMLFVAPAPEGPGDGLFAGLEWVLRAVAVDGRGELPPEAGRPPPAALAAPGIEVLSTAPGGGFDFFTGGSLAAAHLTGVLALLLEELGPREENEALPLAAALAAALRGSARPAGERGLPVIDVPAALDRLASRPDVPPTPR